MKSFLFLIMMVLNLVPIYSQWSIIPHTEGFNISEIEISNDYLFVSKLTEDSAFIRLNLNNPNEIEIMKNTHNAPFSQYGWKEIKAIDEHVMYTDMDTFFISHDYGASWNYINDISNNSGMHVMAKDSNFFVGEYNGLMSSNDYGYSFQRIYYNPDSNLRPLIVLDDKVYFAYNGGLAKNPIDAYGVELINNTPNLIYGMVQMGDKLIGSSYSDIYESSDLGYTWQLINDDPFGSTYLTEIVKRDDLLFAVSGDLHVSFDQGLNFFSLNEGLPSNTGVRQVKIHGDNIYIATYNGAYKRSLSSIIRRKISGKVFYDKNTNGIFDLNDQELAVEKLQLSSNGYTTFSDQNGNFTAEYTGHPDTLKYFSNHSHYNAVSSHFYSNNMVDSIDFAIQIDSSLLSSEVTVVPLTNSRPGFNTYFNVIATNYGSGILEATLKVKMDNMLDITQLSDSNFTIMDDTLTWNFNLPSFGAKGIRLSCYLPADIEFLGDTIKIDAILEPRENDLSPSNNSYRLNQIVTGSYDPNDKSVLPATGISPEFVLNENDLEYLIRFQNTGTDTAFNVVIKDTLDSNLAINSFQFLASSHPVRIEIDSLNILSFHFENIFLPDSIVNEVASHGYVKYKIKSKTDLQLGDRIKNTAYIYFDFNPAIITNTVSTFCVSEESLNLEEETNFIHSVFYPNPNKGAFLINSTNYKPIQIWNIRGEKMAFNYFPENGELKLDYPFTGVIFISYLDEKSDLKFEKIILE